MKKIECIIQPYNLDVVAGHDKAKAMLRAASSALKKGRNDVVPMGYLIGGPVGTGKTFTAIHSANQLNKPILAITPASLRENFKKELKATGTTGAHVVSYQQALKQMHDPKFRERAMNSLVVMDEAHNMGHAESDRSALSTELPGQKLLLTGTTIRNRPHEIAPLINAVAPGSLPTGETAFNNKYVATRELPVSFWGRMRGEQPGVVHIPMNLDQFGKAVRGKIDFHENIDRSNYPSFKESIVEVPMTQKQQDTYQFALGKFPMMATRSSTASRRANPNRRT